MKILKYALFAFFFAVNGMWAATVDIVVIDGDQNKTIEDTFINTDGTVTFRLNFATPDGAPIKDFHLELTGGAEFDSSNASVVRVGGGQLYASDFRFTDTRFDAVIVAPKISGSNNGQLVFDPLFTVRLTGALGAKVSYSYTPTTDGMLPTIPLPAAGFSMLLALVWLGASTQRRAGTSRCVARRAGKAHPCPT